MKCKARRAVKGYSPRVIRPWVSTQETTLTSGAARQFARQTPSRRACFARFQRGGCNQIVRSLRRPPWHRSPGYDLRRSSRDHRNLGSALLLVEELISASLAGLIHHLDRGNQNGSKGKQLGQRPDGKPVQQIQVMLKPC